MHEYSIVNSLIELCEEQAKAHNAKSVEEVHIAIGERSGVEKALIENAFESFKLESSVCQNAKLCVKIESVVLECKDCALSFEIKGLNLAECPQCQSQNTHIIQGKELHLLSLEMSVES